MSVDAAQMLEMSGKQLDDLFRQHEAGEIPTGEARGTVLIRLGRTISHMVSTIAHRIAWKGKVFDPDRGELRNEVSPLGLRAIRAKVYKAQSWFDGKECIVLDYSTTSFVARKIRDEIREVSPGVFLGIVFWGRTKLINFTLTFPSR
jgi:hypothetical protein